ncbi:MAG: thioredoxin domain-containing protein [Candidatus Delongbacteria bacterium]|nr:thioredoxin domain-containing protein [Candidatus Delongbacteria bacterium]
MISTLNRLQFESSPYLLQHRHNPVDWYPWGEEAFARARELDRPLFVSIGYSTCHWCHVMEHESFADPDIAALMNRLLVCVKIDREERPDLDEYFMHHCQLLTGSGGWPLTVVLTPTGEVFYAGTYFPPRTRHGRMGMHDLVPRLAQAWREDRTHVLESVSQIQAAIEESSKQRPGLRPGNELQTMAAELLLKRHDPLWGGFGDAPRFPTAQNLQLLLQLCRHRPDRFRLEAVERTLQEMRRGGIFDQLGLGWHRYSTDKEWRVPHFEKMLYDQALLVPVYLEAWRQTERPFYRQVVRETCDYVIQNLLQPNGGFRSAEDADSEGEEGRFHVWTHQQLHSVLGAEGTRALASVLDLPAGGNWQGESGHEADLWVLRLPGGPGTLLEDEVLPSAQSRELFAVLRPRLLEARERRPRPFMDDKVLADWNGMMLSAMAQAAWSLNDPGYLAVARDTAHFLLDSLRDPAGHWLRRWRDGQAGIAAQQLDLAALCSGFLDLYTADGDPTWLEQARGLQEIQDRDFLDSEQGGYWICSQLDSTLPIRRKEFHDGALPSGNSLALENLVRLGRLCGDDELLDRAEALVALAHANHPLAMGSANRLLCGLDELRRPRREIVLWGDPSHERTHALLEVVRRRWQPGQVLHRLHSGQSERLCRLAPWLEDLAVQAPTHPMVFVCQNHSCALPCGDPEELEGKLA